MRPPATSIAGCWTTSPPEARRHPAPSHALDATWRRTNLGHLLFVATGLCIHDKLDAVHRAGFGGVTDAQFSLFQHLSDDGDRLTALAARAGLAKQSMIELIDKAERQRLVERRLDPADGRAKIVAITPLGRRMRSAAEQGMEAAERRFAGVAGETALAALKRELTAYTGGSAGGIERVLADAARHFVHDVLEAAHGYGHGAVTEALLALFRHLDLDGSRLTDVAVAARITKQSMRALVERAEALRLVERVPDSTDRRAKIIRFTAAGVTMLGDMRQGVARAEARFAAAASAGSIDAIKTVLTAYGAAGAPPSLV